jgi:uncharacterized membrane protein
MSRLSVTRTISAPVEVVFGYVDDYHNLTRFMKDLSTWEPAGSQVHGKGAVFKVGMKAGPMTIESTVEITDWVENASIGFVSRKGFKQSGTWSFARSGSGSAATLDVEYEFPGGFAGKIAARAAEPIMRGNLERSVTELKAQTERLAAARKPAAKPAAASTAAPAAANAAKPAAARTARSGTAARKR